MNLFSKQWFFDLDSKLRKLGLDCDDKSFDELLNNAALKAYVISMENDETARNKKLALSLTQMLLSSDTETIVKYYASFMPSGITEFTYEDNCKRISVCDIESPSTVSIYPATFEDKDRISEIIKEYNASHDKDDEISYTDYVALLMSGITTIINAISYVLIAFVAISLVVFFLLQQKHKELIVDLAFDNLGHKPLLGFDQFLNQ